jgi:hypothetical protein
LILAARIAGLVGALTVGVAVFEYYRVKRMRTWLFVIGTALTVSAWTAILVHDF